MWAVAPGAAERLGRPGAVCSLLSASAPELTDALPGDWGGQSRGRRREAGLLVQRAELVKGRKEGVILLVSSYIMEVFLPDQ